MDTIETLKKLLTTGVGAALLTESNIRNALTDMKLTQQAKDYLAKQAIKGKDEVVRVILNEVKRFLTHIQLHEEIRKALSGLTIAVDTTIKISAPTRIPKSKNKKVIVKKIRSRKKLA